MKTEHTPGEWKAHGCTVYEADKWQDGKNMGGKFIVGIGDEFPTEERLANAQLIAAAPAMLEALQYAAEELGPQSSGDNCWVAIDKAKAAIAKATGGAS
jgi:hypothetical protein